MSRFSASAQLLENRRWDEPVRHQLPVATQEVRTVEIPDIPPGIPVVAGVDRGAQHRKDDDVQEIGSGMVAELKAQKPCLTVDAEVELKMIMEMVVQFRALTDSGDPVFKELNERIRLVSGVDRTRGDGRRNSCH